MCTFRHPDGTGRLSAVETIRRGDQPRVGLRGVGCLGGSRTSMSASLVGKRRNQFRSRSGRSGDVGHDDIESLRIEDLRGRGQRSITVQCRVLAQRARVRVGPLRCHRDTRKTAYLIRSIRAPDRLPDLLAVAWTRRMRCSSAS